MRIHKDIPEESRRGNSYRANVQTLPNRADLEKGMLPLLDPAYARAVHTVNDAKSRLESTNRSIEDYDARVREYTEAREAYRGEIPNRTRAVETAEKALKAIKPKDITRQLSQLLKQRKIVGASVIQEGNQYGIRAVTVPLFANIRTAAGAKTKKRTMLGCFEIKVWAEGHAQLKNLTFSNQGHWAIPRGGDLVCQGEWSEMFRAYMRAGNLALAVQTAINLIEASSQDGAAYSRAHDWKAQRQYPFASSNNGRTPERFIAYPSYELGYQPAINEIVYFSCDGNKGYARVAYIDPHGNDSYILETILEGTYNESGDLVTMSSGGYPRGVAGVINRAWAARRRNMARVVPSIRTKLMRVNPAHGDEINARKIKVILGLEPASRAKVKPEKPILEWLDELTDEEARGIISALIVR